MRDLGILLAAGASRRFGPADKLLADWHGIPLVRHAALSLLAAGLDAVVAIVSSSAVARALPPGISAHFIPAGQPFAATFHAAIDLAQARADRVVVCLGDMPGVSVLTLRGLLALPGSGATIHDGVRMPPLRLDAVDFSAARAGVEGDRGARAFVRGLAPSALIPVGWAEARDIDLMRDLE